MCLSFCGRTGDSRQDRDSKDDMLSASACLIRKTIDFLGPHSVDFAYTSLARCGHVATLAAREAAEMNISNWAFLLIRQRERMANRIAGRIPFKVPASQWLLGRFYKIINIHETFST